MASARYKKWLEPDGLIRIEGWARSGLTEEQISHNMGISVKTLYNWKNSHLPILQALNKGKEVVDFEVENALLKRALGGRYEETKIEILPDGRKKAIQITKEIPPDTVAAIFWLKNRKSKFWRDHPENDELIDARVEQIDAQTSRILGENIELEDTSAADALIYGGKDDEGKA